MYVNKFTLALAGMQIGSGLLMRVQAAKADGNVSPAEVAGMVVGGISDGINAAGLNSVVVYEKGGAPGVARSIVAGLREAASQLEKGIDGDNRLTLGEVAQSLQSGVAKGFNEHNSD